MFVFMTSLIAILFAILYYIAYIAGVPKDMLDELMNVFVQVILCIVFFGILLFFIKSIFND